MPPCLRLRASTRSWAAVASKCTNRWMERTCRRWSRRSGGRWIRCRVRWLGGRWRRVARRSKGRPRYVSSIRGGTCCELQRALDHQHEGRGNVTINLQLHMALAWLHVRRRVVLAVVLMRAGIEVERRQLESFAAQRASQLFQIRTPVDDIRPLHHRAPIAPAGVDVEFRGVY